ncbi:hypothetical protein H5O69_001999 [Enterococcus hirae]|nr:hypothetical protein [Enterococcus hirae]
MFEDYFDIDSIISYLKQAPFFSGLDEKAIGALNGLLNILFGIGKSIVLSGNYLIKNVYSVDILNDSIDKVFNSGEQVWDSIFKILGVVFLTILFIYAVRDILKYGMQKIFMRLLVFGSLVIVATGFYSNGASWLKDINTISGNMQSELVAVMAPEISKDADNLSSDLGLTPPTDTTDKVENMLYYKFILEPFALFNYGKTDISKEQYTELTAKKGKYDDVSEDISDRVDKNSEKNPYLTGKKLGDKYLILLNSGIDYVIVAGIILLISVMNFLVQIFILALVLISPIWVALALLPDNEHVLMNGMKLILGSFALKIALGIGFGFIFMILNFIDSAFGLTSITAIVASLIIKVILAILVVKNFHWFKNVITKAEVDHVPDMKLLKNDGIGRNTRKEIEPDYNLDNDMKNGGFSSNPNRYNNEYADNVQLQSALEDESSKHSNFGENIMRGMGYIAGRGLGNAVLDKIGDKAKDMYEDSKLQNVVDNSKEFAGSPSEYLKDRLSPYSYAYSEGNIEGLNKTYGIDPNGEQEIRMNEIEEEKENKEKNNNLQEFERELALLRGEEVSDIEVPVNEYTSDYSTISNFNDVSDDFISHDRANVSTMSEQEIPIETPLNSLDDYDFENDSPELETVDPNMEREEELNEIDS